MALPTSFTNCETYFNKCLSFLDTYKWIFNSPNTHVITNRVFSQIPEEWTNYLEKISNEDLNNLALGKITVNTPHIFNAFISEVNRLKPTYTKRDNSINAIKKNIKLSRKKAHEILKLTPIIHRKCEMDGVDHIIDIGAGLGYLPRLLNSNHDYKILGIEGNAKYVETASVTNNSDSIKYKQHFVNRNSADDIAQLFNECFPNCESPICVTALHACADLTVHVLNIFIELEIAKTAVIMPCCYHRMQGSDDAFDNFPLSDELKMSYGRCGKRFLTRTFLRLACQQSDASWREMSEDERCMQAKNCYYRNILQDVVEKECLKISRRKRKTGSKTSNYTFEEFSSNVASSYKFCDAAKRELDEEEVSMVVDEIRKSYHENAAQNERLMEVFVALQFLVQGVCENLVLLDRCVYMRSMGVECVTEKITDDSISPRCYAFIVTKIK